MQRAATYTTSADAHNSLPVPTVEERHGCHCRGSSRLCQCPLQLQRTLIHTYTISHTHDPLYPLVYKGAVVFVERAGEAQLRSLIPRHARGKP